MMKSLQRALLGATAVWSISAGAQPQPFLDAKVQPPQLAAPQRGSLVGQYAQTAFGPSDVSRGTFSLPSPFKVPTERGTLLASPFPSYSPESGLSEWGMGWGASLSVYRWRSLGDLDYATDELNGPWGRMVQGSDGTWYPAGFSSPVRMVASGTSLVAYLPDGSQWTFGSSVRVASSRGVYAWYLQEVRDVSGALTRFSYEVNASGRPFVSAVEFGGRGTALQYRVEWEYQPLERPFVDYRAGMPLQLDRRVSQVKVRVRDTAVGTWQERWRYDLEFQAAELGPAFFLTKVQQTYASGATPPPTRFTYNAASEALAAASFQPLPELDGLLSTYGGDIIQPFQSSTLDVNHDGRPDLEEHVSNTLLVREDNGFRAEPLSPRNSNTVEVCRRMPDWTNEPRLLAQMRADVETFQVVDLRPSPAFTETEVTICDREGQLMNQQVLQGDWSPGANSRLVDLNRDRKPDLLQVYPGGYEVLPNASAGTHVSFGAVHSGTLMPYFSPHTTWVHDFNGDGLVDLVARHEGGLTVWYGRGGFDFDPVGQGLPVYLWYGAEMLGLLDSQLTFSDLNRDGLTDLLLTQSGFTSLFINTGASLTEVTFSAQGFFDGMASPAVVGDLSGKGGLQIAAEKLGRVYAATLDTPGTSQLRSADDGKGSVLRFDYQWSPPVVGARQRQAVISKMTVEASGNASTQFTYGYAQPVLHPQGKFLLGYAQVERSDGITSQSVDFLHEVDRAGLILASRTRDSRTPGVRRIETNTYESALFQGLPWKRLKETRAGWDSGASSPALEESTQFAAYDGLCPVRTVLTTAQGSLTTEHTRAALSGLTQHLHCLEERLQLTGHHTDASLDFQHVARLTRNPVGLVEKVESLDGTGAPMVLQQVAYRSDFTIDRVSVPGQGTTLFDYAPGVPLLRKVTSPDGRILEVSQRDPRSDNILGLESRRGGKLHAQFFEYDGQERLARQWDNLGLSTQANPDMLLAYEYATALTPAATSVTSLVDGSSGAKQERVEWSNAAGDAVGSAQRIPQGWTIEGLTRKDRGQLATDSYTRSALPSSTPLQGMTYAHLLFGAQQIGSARAAGFGHSVEVLAKVHADVERQVTADLSLVPGFLEQRQAENGSRVTTTWMDAGKRVQVYEDAAHTRYSYGYDAMGRLRSVLLPGGKRHRLTFDGHGRVARVEREGVATLEYLYDATSGLLRTRRSLSPQGVLQRLEDWTYDTVGRKTLELHTDASSGATQSYRFYYDGATPTAPLAQTDVGMLTAVEGVGYSKTFEYRADGKLSRRVLHLNGWRTVESSWAYTDSGEPREEENRVRDVSGGLLSRSQRVMGWDTYGRMSSLRLNGQPLATLSYDGEGQLTSVSFGAKGTVTFEYDALTQQRVGVGQTTPTASTSARTRLNNRGWVGTEQFSVGSAQFQRQYEYSPQGFLLGSTDAQDSYVYTFDGFGLPLSIEANGTRRDIVEQEHTLQAGQEAYQFDVLGRTIIKGGLRFTYGPNGHVATAQSSSMAWQYLYDEAGHRILKSAQGVPVAGYLAGGIYLDATGLTEPVRVGNHLIGVIQGGVFQMVATDSRGTVMAEADGTPRLASPFGDRTVHPQLASALDYVEKGYDADLGLTRMGVRDYDARINRFLTPDPLFLEHPERCLSSPVECNLYSYAKASPVNFVDPEGTCSAPAGLKVGEVGICIESFISTKYVPGTPGLGDNRTFAPDNASKTSRTTSWLKVSIADAEKGGQKGVAISVSQAHQAGVSEATPIGPGIQGTNENQVKIAGYNFDKDYAVISYQTRGVNGWNWAWPFITKEAIDLQLNLTITRDGKVGLGAGGKHDGYPSYGVYAYSRQADGTIKITTLYEFKEITLDRLGGDMDVDIMKTQPKK
ncbi:FG-GAP-like repeat-containing protein [Stigmatella sp. ncwal1]|uniref:FG-GAP-like repeat-containing protein n=1 Tax=Stigmatella ashevillensis TaxID=2995309 RepID=A0ABT5DPT7_9BACT|nr:RHS repeat-associated core domain-containing protein [Stigmatella ashevillena]MDC0714753.1 FG-GAP-like repeat-containing protein [Stigmatella ashevillena]